MKEKEDFDVEPANPEQIIRISKAVLDCSLDGVPASQVCLLAIGWLRAAHAQMMAISGLVEANGEAMKAPNLRAFAELAIRIVWLHELDDRTTAMPILIAEAQTMDRKFVQHASEMGLTVAPDAHLQVLDPEALGTLDRSLSNEARAVVQAAKSAKHVSGIYALWHAATQLSHATPALALAWVSIRGEEMWPREPAPNQWESSLHLSSVMLCAFTGQILMGEVATKEVAMRFVAASVGGLAPVHD